MSGMKGQFYRRYEDFSKRTRYKNTAGYILIYYPEHPSAKLGGYYLEHRYVIEQHIKRFLKPTEIVHHINGIKDDNRLENLILCKNAKKHGKYHKRIKNGL